MRQKVRFYLGVVFFGLAWILPVFGFLVARLPLSLAAKAVFIGLLTVGGPELFGITAVVCLDKENLLRIKDFFGPVTAPADCQPRESGPLPAGPGHVPGAADPHLHHGLRPPVASGPLPPAALCQSGRGLHLSGQSPGAGGDFWDKLRGLFVYDARVEFGPPPSENP